MVWRCAWPYSTCFVASKVNRSTKPRGSLVEFEMSEILITNGRIVDPSQHLDRVANLLLRGDQVVGIDLPPTEEATIIDATNRLVVPGLIDINTQLQEPGWEEDETIKSGTAAALAGGFASIACGPNTDPPLDSQASVEFVQHQAALADHCNVFVLACVSKNRDGQELAELGSLHAAGAVGFTDAGRPIHNADLMRRALQYAKMFDRPVLNHPEVPELNQDGVMHEGSVSTILGLPVMPAEAEDVMTGRDIRLAEATQGKLHLVNISSGDSVELLRRAKDRGVAITAGIAAHHFSLTHDLLRSFDSNCKVNPPLRSQRHVEQCIQGLMDDTLDVICSGHSPRAHEKKIHELDRAPFGINSLETTLGLIGRHLVEPGYLTWLKVVEKTSWQPARVLGLQTKGSLAPGFDADVTIIDHGATWTVEPDLFRSKSRNTPLAGRQLLGRADAVIVGGRLKFQRQEAPQAANL